MSFTGIFEREFGFGYGIKRMREILDFLIGVYANSLSHIVSMHTRDETEGYVRGSSTVGRARLRDPMRG
jgi:hypothetical protein